MSFLYYGFQSWNVQACRMAKEQTDDERRLAVALKGENLLETAIVEAGYTPYMNKRIFDAEKKNRREVDAIVIKENRVLVVEVKNWRGSVWRHGSYWFQLPKPNQQALKFDDILDVNKKKATILQSYLEDQTREPIPAEAIIPVLVFTSRYVKLDPNSITNMNEYVFTLENFKTFLKTPICHSTVCRSIAGGNAETPLSPAAGFEISSGSSTGTTAASQSSSSWFGSMMRAIPVVGPLLDAVGLTGPQSAAGGGPRALSAAQVDMVKQAIGEVKTWDTLVLHNKALLTGDILSIEIPSAKVSIPRNTIEHIRVDWADNTMWGMCNAMWAGSAAHITIKLKKRRNSPREIKLPIKVSYSRDPTKVDRIRFRAAGNPKTQQIPVTHVKSVIFGDPSAVASPQQGSDSSSPLASTPILGRLFGASSPSAPATTGVGAHAHASADAAARVRHRR